MKKSTILFLYTPNANLCKIFNLLQAERILLFNGIHATTNSYNICLSTLNLTWLPMENNHKHIRILQPFTAMLYMLFKTIDDFNRPNRVVFLHQYWTFYSEAIENNKVK